MCTTTDLLAYACLTYRVCSIHLHWLHQMKECSTKAFDSTTTSRTFCMVSLVSSSVQTACRTARVPTTKIVQARCKLPDISAGLRRFVSDGECSGSAVVRLRESYNTLTPEQHCLSYSCITPATVVNVLGKSNRPIDVIYSQGSGKLVI